MRSIGTSESSFVSYMPNTSSSWLCMYILSSSICLTRLVIFVILKPRAFEITKHLLLCTQIRIDSFSCKFSCKNIYNWCGSYCGVNLMAWRLELRSIVRILFKLLVLKYSFSQFFIQAIKFSARRDVPLALKYRPVTFKSVFLMLLFWINWYLCVPQTFCNMLLVASILELR